MFVGFDGKLYLSPFLKTNSSALPIFQVIFDANLAVEMVCTLNLKLRLFRFAGIRFGFNDLFYDSGQSGTRLSSQWGTPGNDR